MYERRRNIVLRPDGKRINVARPRGQLFVCAQGCCCGRTEDGFPAVPAERFHQEWERRRLRNVVHLTIGGCLGPCALANVVLLLFDGQAQWYQGIDTEDLADALYDHIEAMLDADAVFPPSGSLTDRQFTATAWQPRPDGQPVDDARPWRRPAAPKTCEPAVTLPSSVERAIADLIGPAAMPRKNGELVFEEPWQGRAFGMAVALHERGLYEWNEFRDELIAQIAVAERRPEPFKYYDCWLATFEVLLAKKQIVADNEIDERTYQFEFGERDDVY
ncbi:MAG: nitrile hydratase accessory protein [Dehalococcoidia bacterium]